MTTTVVNLLVEDEDPEITAEVSYIRKKISDCEDPEVYEKSDDALLCLTQICRVLERKENNRTCNVRRQLGRLRLVENDLLPLLKIYCLEDKELFDMVLRILKNLTFPVLALPTFNEQIPTAPDQKQLYIHLMEFTARYKEAFGSSRRLWDVLAKYMGEFLQMEPALRGMDDKMRFERILVLIRNLLMVPSDTYREGKTNNEEMNPHDRLIIMMEESVIRDIIQLLFEDEDNEEYALYILEIMSLMLREQSPEFLAKSYDPNKTDEENYSNKRNEYERAKDQQELELLLSRDKSYNGNNRRTVNPSRRFKEATYCLKNMKSISDDRDIIYHKPIFDPSDIKLGETKQVVRKAKNKRILIDADGGDFDEMMIRRSTPKVRVILAKLCHDFLKSYNRFMAETRHQLKTQKSEDHDESYYLWAAAFFMEFNRNIPGVTDVALVSETYCVETLHYFHTLMSDYIDHLKVEKENFRPWSRRLHNALKAYRELINTLSFMYNLKSSEFYSETRKLKSTIFYEEEYREHLLNLLKEYTPAKMTRRYLIDLVNANHTFLRLFKSHCVVHQKIIVNTKKRKGGKKRSTGRKKKKSKKQIEKEAKHWEEVNDLLKDCLKGLFNLPTATEEPDVIAMDSSVDFDPEEQKMSVIRRISHFLHSQDKVPAAVALLRNARETYPDDEEQAFGHNDITPEEEEELLKEIYEANLEEVVNEQQTEVLIEEEGQDSSRVTVEKELHFGDFFKKYCIPRVVIPHILLLKDYDRNKPSTNHAVIKFLYRVTFEYDLVGMLFQASVFRIFQRILKDTTMDNEYSKEIRDFVLFVFRRFVTVFPKNDKILVEILFWKTAREGKALEEGYLEQGTEKEREPKTKKGRKKAEKKNFISSDLIDDDDDSSDSESDDEELHPRVLGVDDVQKLLANNESDISLKRNKELDDDFFDRDTDKGEEEEEEDDDDDFFNRETDKEESDQENKENDRDDNESDIGKGKKWKISEFTSESEDEGRDDTSSSAPTKQPSVRRKILIDDEDDSSKKSESSVGVDGIVNGEIDKENDDSPASEKEPFNTSDINEDSNSSIGVKRTLSPQSNGESPSSSPTTVRKKKRVIIESDEDD